MITPTRPSAQSIFERAFHPFRAGTAEADAFHAGIDEGHALGRAALREEVEA